jgi:glycosyltransferase involved in cell wall biosynthesis
MKRYKVAHVTTIDFSLRYLLLGQLRNLLEAGYDVTGVSCDGKDVPALTDAGIRHLPVPMTRNFTPLADVLSFWRLYKTMKRERFAVVHTHTPKACLYGQLAARLAGVPVVLSTLHGFYFHENMSGLKRQLYKATETIAARCSDVVLSVNGEDIKTAEREGICSPKKMRELGSIGIDIQRFDRDRIDADAREKLRAELGIANAAAVVGFVGRLVAEKGIVELMQAARIAIEQMPGIRFLLVGPIDHEKPDALTPEVARKHGIADACVFTGMRQDLPLLYSVMDIFVLPSYREGFPLSVMEASAMRVPCVVTNVRGCREAVRNGENGLIVPLKDVPALAEAILELARNPEKARRMGETGRRMAMERFDERRIFEVVKAEYARLLSEKGMPIPAEAEQRHS